MYTAREKMLEGRAKPELEALGKLSNDLNRGYDELEGEPSKLTHWVWDMEQEVDRVHDRLIRRQIENLDGDETTIARQKLINALKGLSESMSDYNGSVYLYSDPEYEVTDEVRAKVAAAEEQAKKNLPYRIAGASEAIQKLREGYDADIGEIRLKRQLMDQVLVNAELP